ncbi:LolA-like protein [Actinophytocola algeriensis]|jgi:hypothetical protein|uniref:LppX_LprAFG lipoprotein n=1 Tax=Actinophytocola algeriensis TaxID=1768010 RepID=A0A7W7PZ27_9PSEU|nr:hypothetical protein [Actinophytocola algeriensis]MBB4903966.1 hypothetical protein [Actinophytocola algeriensis]MBE1477177.1 hypothetical protein [Actinophytocola algeriensis]
MRKAGIALSAFALALTLGACGDNGGSGDSSSNNSGGDSSGGGSVAAASLADLAKSIGEQTSETSTAHMKISADAAGQQLTGEGDLRMSADNAAMSMDMTTPEGTMSMVLLDNIFYIKLPQELEPGKSWLKIDANDKSNPMAQALGGMTEQMSKNADPRATLEQFEKAGEITDTKEEELDGKQTTHYTITVDVEKLAANQEDPTMKSAMDQAIQSGLKDFPVDVWIDEDDLPVRFTMDMPTPNPASGKTESVKMQIDYTDWGKPVDITAPAADEIAEFPGS